jgi:hypothetical protein
LHITLLKSSRQLLAAFIKSFVKIQKMHQPIGRKGLKFIGVCTPCLQKSFVNSKAFGVKRQKTYKFNIILKGEFTKF